MNIKQILDTNVNDIEIDKLKLWNINTTTDGIFMPTYDTFIEKILLITHLFNQETNKKINYLFGMGVAIELALQANVYKRKKSNNCYSYREHNSLYLYNVDKENNNFYNSNNPLFKVFSNINVLNKTNTTNLHNLANDFLDNNYEIVYLYNHKILIPKLEILFLDSYLSKQPSKREAGHDYELLIKEYELDLDKIISYLEEYYINYQISISDSKYDNLIEEQISAIERILNTGKKVDRSLFNLEEQISAYPKGKDYKYAGIYVDLWIPLSIDSIEYNKGSYKIKDDKYINKLKNRIYLYKENELQKYEQITENIKKLFMEGK